MRRRLRSEDGRYKEIAQVMGVWVYSHIEAGGPRWAAEKVRQGMVRRTACCPNHAQSCQGMTGEGLEEVELEHVYSKESNNMDPTGYTSLNEGPTKSDGRDLGEPDSQTGEVYAIHVASTSSADHTGRL